MASGPYSFIDLAVLEPVRTRFAAGDALAILSVDLDEMIWANGAGAALFGFADIEAVMGASPGLGFTARRQIAAAPGFPRMDRDRTVIVRLASGMTSRAVPFQVSGITLPDGEPAVLLAVAAQARGGLSENDVARRAIEGFEEAGYFAALLDEEARIVAASDGFAGLGIATEAIARLVGDVSAEPDRLVKRLVPAAGGLIPAGIARLADAPPLHLLIAIDEAIEEVAPDEAAASPVEAEAVSNEDIRPAVTEAADAPASPDAEDMPAPSDADLPERHEEDETAAHGVDGDAMEDDREPQVAAAASASRDEGEPVGADHTAEHWYFNGEPDGDAPARPELSSEPTAEQPAEPRQAEVRAAPRDIPTGPIRFVWRTDAQGSFSAISDEFVRAVGPEAGNVVGRDFRDVAEAFGLDPSGEIAGLLERRDTWSGRTVFWPIAGTNLVAPVDLAALPVYGRTRTFEGFRGFGVARMGDAVADPQARGISAGNDIAEASTPEPAEAHKVDADPPGMQDEPAPAPSESEPGADDPFQGEVPVISIADVRQRRAGDKVVKLAEHRQPQAAGGQLSAGERNAFEEIRERLRRDYETPARDAAKPRQETDPEADAGDALSARDGETEAEPTASRSEATNEALSPVAETDMVEVQSDTEAEADAVEVPEEVFDEDHLARLDGADGDAVTAASTDQPAPDQPDPTAGPLSDAASAEAEPDQPDRSAPELGGDDDDDVPASRRRSLLGDGEAFRRRDEVSRPEGEPREHAKAGAALEQAEPAVAQTVAPVQAPPIAAEGFTPSAFVAKGSGRASIDEELISGLPFPLLVHAGDDLYFANREFLSLTGYASIEQIRREGGLDRLFVERGPETTTAPEGSKLRLRTLGGSEFPVDAHLQSIGWRGGSALLLSLRRADAPAPAAPVQPSAAQPFIGVEAMERRVAEMRTIIDTATDGVVLIALDGAIRNISRPAEALFGFDSAAVEGKPFHSLFAIESQRAARDYLAGLAENGVASVLNDGREVIGREAEGRFIPLFMTIGRLPSDSGYCAVVRDITQWKRAEEELTQARSQAERASSQKTEFLARVSHEIRTPLNAIIGFSELMIDEKFGPIGSDRYRDYLRDINRSGNHVLDLVNDLLDISKIEAGEQEMNYEAVSLNDALGESVAMMQPQANRDRVIIRSSLASRLPEVVADLRSVRQIALNLLSNAIRYTQAGGQVIVSTSYEPSGDVVMRVRDTGVGMTLGEIDQALKPFKQVNALKRGRHDGTGLGLPLTKAMVEANRARFSIVSTPGEGTLVEITFPSTRVLAD